MKMKVLKVIFNDLSFLHKLLILFTKIFNRVLFSIIKYNYNIIIGRLICTLLLFLYQNELNLEKL